MDRFTVEERAALQRARIVVFADRIITQAQPPITDVQLVRLVELCAAPLPPDLLELWSLCFGGLVDYDVAVRFGDHVAGFSFRELFFPGSDHYRDLDGWIEAQRDYEEEAAEEAGEAHDGRLRYLPIGGFEYLDRLFLDVTGGPTHGEAVAWMQGLPGAWRLRLNQDSSAGAAPSLSAFFGTLVLEDDPFAPTTEFPSGQEMLEAIDALAQDGPHGASAAEILRDLVRSSVLDPAAAVADGSVVHDERLLRLAWRAAVADDDVDAVDRLLALGADPAAKVAGGGTPLDHALQQGSAAVQRRLLDLDVPAPDGIRNAAGRLSAALCDELLQRGATVDATAVLSSAGSDPPAVTERLARTLAARSPGAVQDLVETARYRADGERRSADRVESGQMGSNITPADYRSRAAALDAVADLFTT